MKKIVKSKAQLKNLKIEKPSNNLIIFKPKIDSSLQKIPGKETLTPAEQDAHLMDAVTSKSLLSQTQLAKAKEYQRTHNTSFSDALVELGYLTNQQFHSLINKEQGVEFADLSTFNIPNEVLNILSQEMCSRYCVIPISKVGHTVVLAIYDFHNMSIKDNLSRIIKYRIKFVKSSRHDIEDAIQRHFHKDKKEEFSYIDILTEIENQFFTQKDKKVVKEEKIQLLDQVSEENNTPVIRLLNMLILKAIKNRVSDIHIEPYEKKLRVRFRIDGTLHEELTLPNFVVNQFVSRVKVLCQMDISEKRKPQDGRFKVATRDIEKLDFRVSVLPTMFGEKCVLRLLDNSNLQVDMTKLGFEPGELEIFQENIKKPYGMLLVTGPTGSGKTTTLYSALSELNKPHINLSTVEDPVEFNLFGINQVQVNPAYNVNFASVLRSFLRQDPDVIMVGEIRDCETLEIAIKASLTGHLVLSTLHTNDAPSTLNRMIDMGAKPFMIAASINMIVAQRLVRKVCYHCSRFIKVEKKILDNLGFTEKELEENIKIVKGDGCDKCNHIGYKGRIAIFEVLNVNDDIKHGCIQELSSEELKKLAIKSGMQSLRRSALNKLKEGLTTIEEVINVTKKDDS